MLITAPAIDASGAPCPAQRIAGISQLRSVGPSGAQFAIFVRVPPELPWGSSTNPPTASRPASPSQRCLSSCPQSPWLLLPAVSTVGRSCQNISPGVAEKGAQGL